MITRRIFNYLIGCFSFLLIPWKRQKDKYADIELLEETEPEFQIIQVPKYDKEIVYNIIKSGRKSNIQIRQDLLNRSKVIFEGKLPDR